MTTAFLFAVAKSGISAVNVQLILGVLLAISEALGADPRIKSNGILSFVLVQVRDFLKKKNSDV